MSLICALSNEVPETPIVSPVSGSIFEKRLILKYISEHGTDPINGSELTPEMLIEIKVPPVVRPKPPSATSVPAILKTLQDEWDATVLHAFTLRKQLQTARQELASSMYQHDAACRVIARLTKEVTAAREALATLKPKTDQNASQNVSNNNLENGDHPIEEERPEVGITPEILQKLESKAALLTAERRRRGRTVPDGLATVNAVREMHTVASHTGLHSTSTPGIVSLDMCPTDDSKLITGGNDKMAIIFDKNTEQVVTTLRGHTKKVSSVIYHPNQTTAITASPDASIRVWNLTNSNTTHIVSAHEGPITAISLHATGEFLLSTSTDEFWAFSDLNAGVMLCRVGNPTSAHALTTAQFHPDGLIFGTGTTDSLMKIWDLKEKSNVANFPGHNGSISAMAFSENGFYLATAAEDKTVKLWDLRKLKNFKTISLEYETDYTVKDLYFDNSGTYLAVAGTDVRIYHTKQWDRVVTFEDHTALATGVRFGQNAKFLVSTSLDRSLKIYAPS